MARSNTNILLKGLHGAIGQQIVVKQYGKRTVVTKYPDMSNIKPSVLQQDKRNTFREAVAYAKAILQDVDQKALYAAKVKRGQTVYHYALKEYLEKVKGEEKR
jgi:hypothetical protein